MTDLQEAADRIVREKKSTRFGLYAAVIGVLALGALVWFLFQRSTDLSEGQVKLSQGIEQLNSALKDTCEKVDPNTLPANTREDCDRAKRDEKPPVVEQAPAETISLPATSAQVREEVEKYFQQNPVQGGPTVAQVLEMVNQVYNANPPKDAPPVSVEQRAADVAAYCANNRCRGEQGDQGTQGDQGVQGPAGKDAPPATPAEIFAQVVAYCEANNGCQGPQGAKGEQGIPGRGILNRDYALGSQPPAWWDGDPADTPTQCYEYTKYNLSPFYETIPVNALLCA